MAKVTKIKPASKIDDHLYALRGNSHFIEFIEALKVNCRHGEKVFNAESDRLTSYDLGRQDVANFLVKKLDALSKPAE